jgi:riboflavin transporter FmnP
MIKSKIQVRPLVSVALLSAIAAILLRVEFPLPFMPNFLKLDFSDIPAVLAAFAFGPLSGVAVEFIKNGIGLMFSDSGGVGQLANFIMGSAFVLIAGLIYKSHKTLKGAVAALIIGMLTMSVIACFVNYFITFPFYSAVYELKTEAIVSMAAVFVPFIKTKLDVMIFTIFPFNLIKGTLISLITFIVYKRIRPFMKKAGGA